MEANTKSNALAKSHWTLHDLQFEMFYSFSVLKDTQFRISLNIFFVVFSACTPDVEVAFESGNQIKNTIDWKWIGGTFKSTSETAQYGEKVYKVGRFDGTSSNLYIPFYNRNTEMRKTFATEIVFNPDNGKGNKRQVLLSNCQNVASTAAPFEITLLKDTQDIQISLEAGSNMVAGAEPSQTYTITMKYKVRLGLENFICIFITSRFSNCARFLHN